MAEELREKYAMTLRRVKNICLERDGYEQPHLNDVLELQYKGFAKIENLDSYYNVHALFLEQNSIKVIEGLDNLAKLKCLYLSKNRIERIENLSSLQNLCHLDLSHNPITKVEGLGELKKLELIKFAHCRIEKLEDLEGLSDCQSINSVDVTHNQIDATDEVPEFWGRIMPDLQCLYYNGNPGLRTIKQYRRRLIGQLKSLKFLDERPVFEDERSFAEAWCEGGQEAEKKKRQEHHENKTKAEEEERVADLAWREKAKAMYDSLPKFLPTVNSDEQQTTQNFSEFWEDLKSTKVCEESDVVQEEEVVQQEHVEQQEETFNFDPPVRVEDVAAREGSWEIWNRNNEQPAGPPSERCRKQSVDNVTLAQRIQERDQTYYYRRQASLREEFSTASVANVNEGLMAALAQQENLQEPPQPSRSASDLECEKEVEKESSETSPGGETPLEVIAEGSKEKVVEEKSTVDPQGDDDLEELD